MTTQFLPLPIFRAFDSAGLQLAGGLLYSYAAGSTTPQATYSDAAGAVPNANPVVLDSTGSATVRVDPTLGYKFVLKDSTGVTTYWTADNYYPYPVSTDSVFAARRITSNQTLTASTVQTLAFNTADANPQSAFDASTGIFTANVAGTFEFTTSVVIQNGAVNSGVLNSIYFSKNSGALTIGIGYGQAAQTINGASNNLVYTGSAVFQLAQSDTVKVVLDAGAGFGGGGSFVFKTTSAFSGKKIG